MEPLFPELICETCGGQMTKVSDEEAVCTSDGRHRRMLDDVVCLNCNHPKSDHGEKGCLHLEPLPPQPHGNPEQQICGCDNFRPRLGKGFQVQ